MKSGAPHARAAKNPFRYDVFFSHSTSMNADHDELVGALFHALERRGLAVFWDRRCLKGGEHLIAALEKAVRQSRAAVVFVSRLAARSGWVEFELAEIALEARRRRMPVLAIRLEPACPLPSGVATCRLLVPETLSDVWRLADQVAKAVNRACRSPRSVTNRRSSP
jgi:hypothetical protein